MDHEISKISLFITIHNKTKNKNNNEQKSNQLNRS